MCSKNIGIFTADSLHDWYSASKSLTSMLTGIALHNNIINLDSPATHYLGTGWTVETPQQEDSITLFNLLTMTSGTNPNPTGACSNDDTNAACLQYLVPAGSQWAYHTGTYRKEETVLTNASGKSYDALSENYIGSATGIAGLWYRRSLWHGPLGSAVWVAGFEPGHMGIGYAVDDTAYFNAMIHTSQAYKLSYGYLWWLNGQARIWYPVIKQWLPANWY